MRQTSISSELLMCGGGAHSILSSPLVTRCISQYVQRHTVVGTIIIFSMYAYVE